MRRRARACCRASCRHSQRSPKTTALPSWPGACAGTKKGSTSSVLRISIACGGNQSPIYRVDPKVRALAVVAYIGVMAPVAHAHHSASHWGPIYIERYLICGREPEQVHCVGPIRAGRALLGAFDVGELLPGMNHDVGLEAAHRAAIDAVCFNVREAS